MLVICKHSPMERSRVPGVQEHCNQGSSYWRKTILSVRTFKTWSKVKGEKLFNRKWKHIRLSRKVISTRIFFLATNAQGSYSPTGFWNEQMGRFSNVYTEVFLGHFSCLQLHGCRWPTHLEMLKLEKDTKSPNSPPHRFSFCGCSGKVLERCFSLILP